MPIGETFEQTLPHYALIYDEHTGIWRINNLWHEYWKDKEYSADCPDDCPALTIVPNEVFVKMLDEADRIGLLGRYFPGLEKRRVEKTEEETKQQDRPVVEESEQLHLKKYAIRNIVKLVAMDDVAGAMVIDEKTE